MSAEAIPDPTTVVADVGATFVRVALSRGATLGPIKERRVAELHRHGDDGIVPSIVSLMREAIAGGFSGKPTRVAAAGIGVCASVDDNGCLQDPLPLRMPGGRRVVEAVRAALGVPVVIDNDANMAALGELHHGAGRGLRDFVLIALGTNIGVGIVHGGRVLRGAHGGAGEGGMMLVPAQALDRPDNEYGHRPLSAGLFGSRRSLAPKGYAWVEELVGGGALASALSERRNVANGGTGRPAAPLRVLAEAIAGDSHAAIVVDQAIEGWAYIIANCVALLDPAAIVLSGGLAEDIGPFLERLRRRTVALSRTEPLILNAELGSIGGLIGASTAAITSLGTSVGERAILEARRPEGTIDTTMVRPDLLEPLATAPLRVWSEPDEMAREICQSPEAVRLTLVEFQRDHRDLTEDLARSSNVVLIGTGASFAMARCAQALWASSDQSSGVPRTVSALEASEALFIESHDFRDQRAAVVIVSKSGKSPEALKAAEVSRRAGNRVIAITSDAGSPVASVASDLVLTSIGEEHGAATKSETAALAALLALGGVILSDPPAVDRVATLLYDAVRDEGRTAEAGSTAGAARHIWTVGFGASRGVADALSLLLHEKAQLPAVAASPSGFRHSLVEASVAGDSVVVIECRNEDPSLIAYFDRLAMEGQRVGLKIVWLAGWGRIGLNIRLRGSTQAERVLEAVVRAQQLARAAAHAAGKYADGFRILGRIVDPSKD
jgi:glucokinase